MDYRDLAEELTEAEGEIWRLGEAAEANDAAGKADALFTLSAACNALARVLTQLDHLTEEENKEVDPETLRTSTQGLEAVD